MLGSVGKVEGDKKVLKPRDLQLQEVPATPKGGHGVLRSFLSAILGVHRHRTWWDAADGGTTGEMLSFGAR